MTEVADLFRKLNLNPQEYEIKGGKIVPADSSTIGKLRTPGQKISSGGRKISSDPNALKPGGGALGDQGNGSRVDGN